MSSSFDYLHLPLLAQLEVLRTLQLDDLLAFSLISKKTKNLTTELKTSIDVLGWQFDNDDGAHVIELDNKLTLEIALDDFESIQDDLEFKDVKLNGTTYPVSLHHGHWLVMETDKPESHYLNVMDQFSKHILSVFRVENFELLITKQMDFVNLFVWKYTKTFKEVNMVADELDESEIPVQIDFLMRNLTIRTFYVGLYTTHFKYTGPLTMNSLDIYCCDWLTLEALLGMSCKEVRVDDDEFSSDPSNFNTILKEWIKGDRLRNLEIFQNFGLCEHIGEVLEGIETFPFSEENRPSHWEDNDLSEGTDFRRADGTLATIDEEYGKLCLYIWHPKYLL